MHLFSEGKLATIYKDKLIRKKYLFDFVIGEVFEGATVIKVCLVVLDV